ncbi:putative mitochondrial protein [Cucumis melo var. makuwa]|uniref:Putative mitochondrial protein n=1 Tax=Cucumis melo var. makuwa TaxID=1194695 RepID=A0A5D3DV85_CUCMM|nr:putative mitochondrial protein [Cucumis melo var. makuwa]
MNSNPSRDPIAAHTYDAPLLVRLHGAQTSRSRSDDISSSSDAVAVGLVHHSLEILLSFARILEVGFIDTCYVLKLRLKFQSVKNHCPEGSEVTINSPIGLCTLMIANHQVSARTNHNEIIQLKKKMGFEFEIKDLRNLKYFLKMEITRSREGILVSQRKYTFDLLTEIGLLGCRPADTPIEFNAKLENSGDRLVHVGTLCRPNEGSYKILWYLKETLCKGLRFKKTDRRCVEAYTDSDWARSIVDKKSTIGYYTLVRGNLVTWGNYEMHMKLFCDNKAAISIVNNLVQYDKTKHVENDRHFIKRKPDDGSICIPYIPSNQQIVDILTKGLLR